MFGRYRDPDEWEDLRREFEPRRRRAFYCSDRMCGADDCENCRPGCTDALEEEARAEAEGDEAEAEE